MKARPIRIEGDSAYIPLTKGHEAIIDAADVPLVKNYNWFAEVRHYTVYACRNQRKSDAMTKRKPIQLHRAILFDVTGLDVDHIDGDGLNNRRSNLRAATRQQNSSNQKIRMKNTSGFKGVSWDKQMNKWRAKIMSNYRSTFLGLFTTKDLAYQAYLAASKRMHGEFGRAV